MTRNGNPLSLTNGDRIFWRAAENLKEGSGVVVDCDFYGEDGWSYLVSVDGEEDNRYLPDDCLIHSNLVSLSEIRQGDKVRVTDSSGNYMVGIVDCVKDGNIRFAGGQSRWWATTDSDVFDLLDRPQSSVEVEMGELEVKVREALTNAMNYPDLISSVVMGRDMSKTVDAVMRAVKECRVVREQA